MMAAAVGVADTPERSQWARGLGDLRALLSGRQRLSTSSSGSGSSMPTGQGVQCLRS